MIVFTTATFYNFINLHNFSVNFYISIDFYDFPVFFAHNFIHFHEV